MSRYTPSPISAHLSSLTALNIIPPTTSYFARGKQRYTVILPFTAYSMGEMEPKPGDVSISEAEWRDPVGQWEQISPGNRIIIAHLLWSDMSAKERAYADTYIDEAMNLCADWADTAGLPKPSRPA